MVLAPQRHLGRRSTGAGVARRSPRYRLLRTGRFGQLARSRDRRHSRPARQPEGPEAIGPLWSTRIRLRTGSHSGTHPAAEPVADPDHRGRLRPRSARGDEGAQASRVTTKRRDRRGSGLPGRAYRLGGARPDRDRGHRLGIGPSEGADSPPTTRPDDDQDYRRRPREPPTADGPPGVVPQRDRGHRRRPREPQGLDRPTDSGAR
jgi:hypothetical protein